MTDWASGYVADVNYTHGYYRDLAPAILSLTALTAGVRAPESHRIETYCELGCGQGYAVNLLAAANPQIEFYATDFNPAHVVSAQSLAAAAECTNLHLYDRSFAEFLELPGLPAFDVIALHGIYSWIGPENRAAIVEIINRKLKPGGLVFISYNALPGWSAAQPLRRLFFDLAATETGPTAPRVERALTFAHRLVDTNPNYVRANPGIKERLDSIQTQNRNYLAHEFFNRDWTPFYHADVAAELSAAKLSYIGSTHLIDALDFINLTSQQIALLEEIKNPTLCETLRDYMTNQQFRRDVFIKGAVPLSPLESKERWLDCRFALTTNSGDVPLRVKGHRGEIGLREDIYRPVLDAFAAGAQSVRQLLTDQKISQLEWGLLRETLIILVGSDHLQPALDIQDIARRTQRTKRFNIAVQEKARFSSDLMFLASPVTGGAVRVDRVSQLFLLSRQTEGANSAEFAWEVLSNSGQQLIKDGKTLMTSQENIDELRHQFKTFTEKQLLMLQQLGVVC